MFVRAFEHRKDIERFLLEEREFTEYNKLSKLTMSPGDWRKVRHIIVLLQLFEIGTHLIGQERGVTLNTVIRVYNTLYNHIEKYQAHFELSNNRWSRLVCSALLAAKTKLSDYYSLTADKDGLILVLAMILDPNWQLRYFDFDIWEPHWKKQYRTEFLKFYEKNYLQYEPNRSREKQQVFISLKGLASFGVNREIKSDHYLNEAERYLNLEYRNFETDPLESWKKLEKEFPTLAQMAKDILGVPAANVAVERVFNQARDICHYRRGQLASITVKELLFIKHYQKQTVLSEVFDQDSINPLELQDNNNDSRQINEKVFFISEDEGECKYIDL